MAGLSNPSRLTPQENPEYHPDIYLKRNTKPVHLGINKGICNTIKSEL